MTRGPTWTVEEDETLLSLWQEHKNLSLCAQLMDRAESTVWKHAGRLGIGEPKPQPRVVVTRTVCRENPIQVARDALTTRLEERPTGYYLDGQPAKLGQIMKAANRELRDRGQRQLDANPAWLVHD
jgi:hypothetical protein